MIQQVKQAFYLKALKSVLSSDVERELLIKQEKETNHKLSKVATTQEEVAILNSELKRIYQRMEEIDADSAESRASSILSGLGFSPGIKYI